MRTLVDGTWQKGLCLAVLGGGVALSALLALGIGPVDIAPGRVWALLTDQAATSPEAVIVRSIRLPRVVLAVLVGATLGLAGAVMQGFFQNPMADPYIVGVSSGAGLGASLAFWLGLDFWFAGVHAVSFMAFGGGIGAAFSVWGLAGGRLGDRPTALLLTGVALGALATAVTSFIMLQSGSDMQRILFWLMGSLSSRRWEHVHMIWPYALVGAGVVFYLARDMNLLLQGVETARHLGVDALRVRRLLLIAATLLTAAAVSVSGIIGFVGLVVPHLARLVVGPDHRVLLPVSMLGGGMLLLVADTVARTCMAPAEIPVGIITALLGCPFFLYLLQRQGRDLI